MRFVKKAAENFRFMNFELATQEADAFEYSTNELCDFLASRLK